MEKLRSRIMWVLLTVLLMVSFINLYILLHIYPQNLERRIEVHVEQATKELGRRIASQVRVQQLEKAQNGRDGADGVDGKDGKDSISTHTMETNTVIKEVLVTGKDGFTPIPRCNEKKNRWEVSFLGQNNWTVMLGVDDLPVKCVGV